MKIRNKAAIKGKLNSIDQRLAKGGLGFLEQFNLKALRDSLQSELDDLESPITGKAQVELTFKGTPVLGTRGIEADFGLQASEGFQRAIHRRGAALARANSQRSLAPPHPLAIVDIARGSFGFVLEEIVPEEGLLQGPSHLLQAMEEVQSTLDLARAGDDAGFMERMRTLDGGTAQAIKEFLEVVDGANATFRMRTEDRDTAFDAKDVAAASSWVKRVKLASDTVPMLGVLAGVFTVSRKVEFVPDGRKVIEASISSDLDPHELLRDWAEKPCLATFLIQHKRQAGRPRGGRPTYCLLSVLEHPGAGNPLDLG
ncbi:MAG: hypothetical protein JSU04_04195 [Bdellovibrionales bacterium]|nr:hypothetical protein [Bdellovibrionales bacterium]